VGAVPNTFAKVSDEICLGDSADIAASASWGDVRWFATKQSTNPYATGKFNRTGGFKNPKSYAYFKTIDGICENSNFDSVEILVNIPPTATVVNANNVCNGEKASIQLSTTQGNIIWYFDNAASAPIFTGNTLNLGEIYSNTTRYYETELNGCKSVRNAITVKALDKPAAGFQFVVEFPKKLTCTPLNTNNMNIVWNFGDGNTSTNDIGVNTYATEGQYTVKMAATSTISGCKDSVSVKITVNHNQIENATMTLGVYPNPVAAGSQLFSQTPIETATWYDLSGRLMAKETNTPQTINTPGIWKSTIEVPAHLHNGIYLLQIQAQGNTQTIKIQVD
jgi:PKD repeat protein